MRLIACFLAFVMSGCAYAGATVTMSKTPKGVKRALAAERVVGFLTTNGIDLGTAEEQGCPGYIVQDFAIMAATHQQTVDLGQGPTGEDVRTGFLALPEDSGAVTWYSPNVAACVTRAGCGALAEALAGFLNLTADDVGNARPMGGGTCFVRMKKGEVKAFAAVQCE